ncbi:FecR family protein [Lacinutrix sp. C3R15]|uniref:FecR family protein n=1 Tax=Flavobacteriaceae TaxID=49546 RepID=UPI001C08BDB5|nr:MULTISPECIES: FecR family protein [Flavobacteriaceae]MBU2939412.1 FecR family protein [Lacinutrix sp. C3R15]MDO6622727.1 FecR family protein [Oceanihabitans sp. 1_MG-2023]
MKQEKDILKWFNQELSEKEIADLKASQKTETLSKIAHYASQLEAPKIDAQKALEDFKTRKLSKKETKVKTLNYTQFLRIAAVFAILLTSSYFLFFNNLQSFETQYAETETVQLPDNSEVILNAGSKLSFNKKTWKNERDLELDGEAFFKVAKGKKFTVHTDAGIVQVLGTQFNVKERENFFEVTCYEGLVSVTYNKETVKLAKGKSFRMLNNNVQFKDIQATNPSWLQQESSFTNIPLSQVIKELERQYNLQIDATNVDTNQLFTGSFTHSDKDIALQAVTIPLKLSYSITGKKVTFKNYEAN